mgnify:CR=1 FL=1
MASSDEEDAVYHDAISTNVDSEAVSSNSPPTRETLSAANLDSANTGPVGNNSPTLGGSKTSSDNGAHVNGPKEPGSIDKQQIWNNDPDKTGSSSQDPRSRGGEGGSASPMLAEDQCDFVVVDNTKKASETFMRKRMMFEGKKSPSPSRDVGPLRPRNRTTSNSPTILPDTERNTSNSPTACDSIKKDSTVSEDNIYEDVNISKGNSLDFEIIGRRFIESDGSMSATSSTNKFATGVNYEWKRQQAKKKSRALKRSTDSGMLYK